MKSICVPLMAGLMSVSASTWAHDYDHHDRHDHGRKYQERYEHRDRYYGNPAPVTYWSTPRYVTAQPVVIRQVYPAPVVMYPPPRVVYQEPIVYREAPQYGNVYPGYSAPPRAGASNPLMGQAVGAVAGGVLGNQIGKGNGRVIATAVGAVIGGAVGGQVARY